MRRNDHYEPDPIAGYAVYVANNPVVGASNVGLRVRGGKGNTFSGLPKNAAFETAYGEIPEPGIVTYPVFKAVILALAPIREVHYTRAYSSALMDHWPRPNATFDLSWMVYL